MQLTRGLEENVNVVFHHIPNTEKKIELRVSGNVVKHSLECLIRLHNQN